MEKVNATLENLEELLLLTLFGVTPLLVTTFTYELFEFPKMIFVYIAGSIAISLWFTRFLINQSLKIKKFDVLTILITIFLLINIISSVASPFLYTALWGYYNRFSGGLTSVVIYTGIFLILRSRNNQQLQNVIKTVLLATFIVCCYGIAQHFGLEKNRWVQDVGARVFSSFGQPNWLAAYLTLIIPVNLYILLTERQTLSKIFFFVALVASLITVWFTFSVSGILGALLGLALTLLFTSKEIYKEQWRWVVVTGVLTAVICAAQPGIATGRFEDTVNVVKNKLSEIALTKAFAADITPKVGDTGDIRLEVWRGVLTSATSSIKQLLIGSGPETVAYTFLPFRPLGMNNTSEWSFLYNKAHNYFLDLLSNLGVFGLLTYLAMNFLAIKKAVLDRGKAHLGAALIGNLVTNFFGWPTVMTNLIFYLYIALIINNYE